MKLGYWKYFLLILSYYLSLSLSLAQADLSYYFLSLNRTYNLRIGIVGEYSKLYFSDAGNFSSRILLDYSAPFGSCGLQTNINRGLSFKVFSTQTSIAIPDKSNIMNKADLNREPGSFEQENPFMAYINFLINQFKVAISANIISISEDMDKVALQNIGLNYYNIRFERYEARKYNILVSGSVGYSFYPIDIYLGVLNVPLLSFGDLSDSKLPVRPFLGLGCPLFKGQTLARTNTKEIELSYFKPVAFSWLFNGEPLKITGIFKSNLSEFSYKSVTANIEIPILPDLQLSLGFKKVFDHKSKINRLEYSEFKNSINNIFMDDIRDGFDNTQLSLGISLQIGSSREEFPFRLIGSKIHQKNLYSAKREIYSYNPVGTIDIHNFSSKIRHFQLAVELPDKLGGFRSESIAISQDEIKSIPIYLYLSDVQIKNKSNNILANIIIETEGRKQIISTIPLTIFDKNSWDGNTWGLKYFITPDDPKVVSNARTKYIQSFKKDTSLSENQQQYFTLCNFISELGNNIKYVQDPTSSIYVEKVQYPVETIYEKTGDCDDLSVYLASHLMSVGYSCVLVDIKPQIKDIEVPVAGPSQIGHIFLLVDTGLEAEYVSEIGLKEFQFVSRKSLSGKMTAWIPIETTVISQGFKKAFEEGVRQYYLEVIEKNGISNGSVHVYD